MTSVVFADSFVYPVYPVDKYYTSQVLYTWNSTFSGYHTGEDWNGDGGGDSDLGDDIYSIANGEVLDSVRSSNDSRWSVKWGKYIFIEHKLPSGVYVKSLYAHLETVDVSVGEYVERGQKIGTLGDADGYYSGVAHLHFSIRISDPDMGVPGAGYLPKKTHSDFDHFVSSDFIDLHRTSITLAFDKSGWIPIKNDSGFDFDMSTAGFRFLGALDDVRQTVEQSSMSGHPDGNQWVWDNFASYNDGCAYYPIYEMTVTDLPDGEVRCMYLFTTGLTMTVFSSSFNELDADDHQSQQDMINFVRSDYRYEGVVSGSFSVNLDWSTNFELRYLRFGFKYEDSARLAHATYKSDPAIRYVNKYDPDKKTWGGWSRI